MIERIPYLFLFYPVLLFSLSCHEAAHAWMADRFGDPTARLLGRVTLNPLPHLDMIGTVALPIFAILTGSPLIGWGKPVPVNGLNLKNMRQGELWISAFGPISNLVLALVFAGIGRFEIFLLETLNVVNTHGFGATATSVVYMICHLGVNLNLALAFFNLLPIYPLDGGGVIRGLLPYNMLHVYDRIAQQSVFLLLILFVSGLFRFIFIPVQILANVLLPS